MHIKVIGGFAANTAWARSGCLLVDGRVAFDSGGLASQLSLPEQVAIDHVLLTHAHLDHIGELAFLVDNVLTVRTRPLKIWGPPPVLSGVRQHLFNDQLWPDFSRITIGGKPVVEFCPLVAGEPLILGNLRIRWAKTTHTVFSAGYLVEDAAGEAFLYTGDTGPTEAVWALANEATTLHAVFVEAAFPNQFQELALTSGHLTPSLLTRELTKLQHPGADLNIMHVKPAYLDEIDWELQVLQRPWRIVSGGEEFSFPR